MAAGWFWVLTHVMKPSQPSYGERNHVYRRYDFAMLPLCCAWMEMHFNNRHILIVKYIFSA